MARGLRVIRELEVGDKILLSNEWRYVMDVRVEGGNTRLELHGDPAPFYAPTFERVLVED